MTGLANAVGHTIELRARDAGAGKNEAATTVVTPQGPPRIVSVVVVSRPGLEHDTYGAGEEIRIEVTFDQPVVVTGNPQLALDVGGQSRLAQHDPDGDSDATVEFVYVVRDDDNDDDSIEVEANALRLNGNDGIAGAAGTDAELAHPAPGAQPGHKVDGSQRPGVHTHEEFTHTHSVFNSGKGFYTETYPRHDHDGHEHADRANGHGHPLPGHTHHPDENPNASVQGGPDERSHGGVEHIHRCFDLKPSCNQGAEYRRRGDELGLPIEVRHSHADSEPRPRLRLEGVLRGRRVRRGGVGGGRRGGGRRGRGAVVRGDPGAGAGVRGAGRLPRRPTARRRRARTTGRPAGCWRSRPGRRARGCRVPVLERAPADGEETLTLMLGSATAATLADGAATGTILAPEATTPPVVEGISVVSTPRLRTEGTTNRDTYGEGETIRIEVRFDQSVVVAGEPVLEIEVGDPCLAVCEAYYESGSGTDKLVFGYLVLEIDYDRNGVKVPADSLRAGASATARARTPTCPTSGWGRRAATGWTGPGRRGRTCRCRTPRPTRPTGS